MDRPLPQPIAAPLPAVAPWAGASERLVAAADDPWITPAEAARFDDTPDYATTMAFLRRLTAASPRLRLTEFGTSCDGRPLPLVIASRNGAAVDRAGADRLRLLVQCGIHPGEIDGKDAGLMLLRDIALREKADLLDAVDLFFVPILNVDGHERRSPFARPNQRGPDRQGWRTNAQNLNLNRDYMKADSPEMGALLALIGRVDPDLYVDLHVTDGLDYQYDMTFGWQDPAYSAAPAISSWLETVARPAIDAALRDAGHCPGPLVLARDDRDPSRGLYLPAFPPRFSHAYGDCRRLPTILVENHSLKPVRRRVLGTYALLEAVMRLLGSNGACLRSAIAVDRAVRPTEIVTRWQDATAPSRKVFHLPVAHRLVHSMASGAAEVQWLGVPEPGKELPLWGSNPDHWERMPSWWYIPPAERDAIARIELHGVVGTRLTEAARFEVEVTRLEGVTMAPSLIERRPALRVAALQRTNATVTLSPGTFCVPADQPLATLAAMLLEPSSPDSLFAYGMLAGPLERTEYLEPYVIAPLADTMLQNNRELRKRFDEALAADAAFAADPQARLAWFYRQSAYRDLQFLTYSVYRGLPTQG